MAPTSPTSMIGSHAFLYQAMRVLGQAWPGGAMAMGLGVQSPTAW